MTKTWGWLGDDWGVPPLTSAALRGGWHSLQVRFQAVQRVLGAVGVAKHQGRQPAILGGDHLLVMPG